jgi:hypothetical protein
MLESDSMSALTAQPTAIASTKNTMNTMNTTAPLRYNFGSVEYKEASKLGQGKFTGVGQTQFNFNTVGSLMSTVTSSPLISS